MNHSFSNTNKQLAPDELDHCGSRHIGNVEERKFILSKSPSTSAFGSDHCLEDSDIIIGQNCIDDDVRSPRESQNILSGILSRPQDDLLSLNPFWYQG